MTEVTDKMVEAAKHAMNERCCGCYKCIRAAIEAALAARDPSDKAMSDANSLIWLAHDESGKFSECDKALLLRCADQLLGLS